jgi:hypothetical protein
MDARVVEAYWVGNDLLDAVDPAVFLATLGKRFTGQLTGAVARRWRSMPAAHALAHHSFHVFAVYPWTGLLGSRGGTALSILDSCRVRWGTVVAVTGDRLQVRSRPLTWTGGKLALGAERTEPVRWSAGGYAPHPAPVPGEVVACHWDWVCDRLTGAQAERLAAHSADQLDAANSGL